MTILDECRKAFDDDSIVQKNLMLRKAYARIETLEAALQESIDDWRERNMDTVFLANVNAAHELATEISKNKKLADRIEALEAALKAIRAATLNGSVCDDVAWFGPAETLHDFCDRSLNQQNPDR